MCLKIINLLIMMLCLYGYGCITLAVLQNKHMKDGVLNLRALNEHYNWRYELNEFRLDRNRKKCAPRPNIISVFLRTHEYISRTF